MKFSEEIAKISIETGAIQLNPETPFLWASGYRMPIYNDNRLLLGNSQHRQLIAEGFNDIITSIAVSSLWWDFGNFGVILDFLTKKFDFSLIFIISLIFKHNVLKYDKKFTQHIKF